MRKGKRTKKRMQRGIDNEMEKRLRRVEKWVEKREKRRKKLLIRRLEVKERKRKEAVKEIMKLIGVELKVEEVWKIADNKKNGRELMGVRVEKEEKKREI